MDIITQGASDTDLTMTSLEIAEVTGRRHNNVRRTIKSLMDKGVIQLAQIEQVMNKQTLSPNSRTSAYIFTGEQGKRDSIIVVAQIMPEVTARIVDRWQELERQAATPELPDFTDPVIAARAWADEREGRALAEQAYEDASRERDEAIRTKGMIGSTREAKAMSKASVVCRQLAKRTAERDQIILERDQAVSERDEARAILSATGESSLPHQSSRRAVGAFLAAHGIRLPKGEVGAIARMVAQLYRAQFGCEPSQIWPEWSKYPAKVYPQSFLFEKLSEMGVLHDGHGQMGLL